MSGESDRQRVNYDLTEIRKCLLTILPVYIVAVVSLIAPFLILELIWPKPARGTWGQPENGLDIIIGMFVSLPLAWFSGYFGQLLWLSIIDGKFSDGTLALFTRGRVGLEMTRRAVARWRGRLRRTAK